MVESPITERQQWFERRALELLPDLYGAALRLTKDEADAEELVAESLSRAWAKLDSLRDERAFRGWVFRILTNSFLCDRRSQAARGSRQPLEDESGEQSFSLFERLHMPFLLWRSDPEQRFLDRLLRRDLTRAVDELPDEYRVAVVLCDIQGFSYREIAETLDVPLGTVRSRLSRGRSLLQEALWSHVVDAGLRAGEPERQGDG